MGRPADFATRSSGPSEKPCRILYSAVSASRDFRGQSERVARKTQ